MLRNNRLEDRIRDFLGEHLDLLEPKLVLIEKEYVIDNPMGAGGRIDLLARDRFGHFVIIEIKRSDQAAREALHEIHKYTALFRLRKGLDERQVRLLVISTDWHELLLPWSECLESFAYAAEGISIKVEVDGTVTHVERVTPISRAASVEISRVQAAYLFESKSVRDSSAVRLVEAAAKSGLSDFAVFEMNYFGSNPMVCFRFGLYLVFSSPLRNNDPTEVERLKQSIEWDATLDQLDENFLVTVNKHLDGLPDDIEMGYPEKLTNIRTGWSVRILRREGRLSNAGSLYNDDEILALSQAVEGGSPVYICRIASPKHEPSWARMRTDLQAVLKGMPQWERIVPRFLVEVQENSPDSAVSIYVYNPANLSMALYGLAHGDPRFCQHMEIVVEEPSGQRVRVLFSAISWDGKELRRNAEKTIKDVFGSIDHWLGSMTLHQTFVKEPLMLKLHHLDAPVVEIIFYKDAPPKPVSISSTAQVLIRKPLKNNFGDINEFRDRNKQYIESFKNLLDSHSCGLAESDLFNRQTDE